MKENSVKTVGYILELYLHKRKEACVSALWWKRAKDSKPGGRVKPRKNSIWFPLGFSLQLALCFTLFLPTDASACQTYSGGVCGGGGTSVANKMFSEFARTRGDLSGSQKAEALLKELELKVPSFGKQLRSRVDNLTFYVVPARNDKVTTAMTGLPDILTEQIAIHGLHQEVFIDEERFKTMSEFSRTHLLVLEFLEEYLLRTQVNLPAPEMHAKARQLTTALLGTEEFPRTEPFSEQELQKMLAANKFGYFPTAEQEEIRSRAVAASGAKVSADAEFLVIQRGEVIDPKLRSVLRPGENFQISVRAIDPNGLPLEYRLGRNSSDNKSYFKAETEWQSDPFFSVSIRPEDVNSRYFNIGIQIRNSDGRSDVEDQLIRDDSEVDQYIEVFPYRTKVEDGLEIPPVQITKFEIYLDGKKLDPDQSHRVLVGEANPEAPVRILKLVATAEHPHGLPIEYEFNLFGSVKPHTASVDYSSNNEAIFRLTSEIAGQNIRAYVEARPVIGNRGRADKYKDWKYAFNRRNVIFVSDGDELPKPSVQITAKDSNGVELDTTKARKFTVGEELTLSLKVEEEQYSKIECELIYYNPKTSKRGTSSRWGSCENMAFVPTSADSDLGTGTLFLHARFSDAEERQKFNLGESFFNAGLFQGSAFDDERKKPIVVEEKAKRLFTQHLGRVEAGELLELLQTEEPELCSMVTSRLQEFLANESRSELEILAFMSSGIDQATLYCTTLINIHLPHILGISMNSKADSRLPFRPDRDNTRMSSAPF